MINHDFYYFGCGERAGHYMWLPGMRSERHNEDGDFVRTNPWGLAVDGSLYPKNGDAGALLHHKDGWTALSFIDNSVDRRPGSHSTFLARGQKTFDEMVELAEKHFPTVVRRYGRMIVEAPPGTLPKVRVPMKSGSAV